MSYLDKLSALNPSPFVKYQIEVEKRRQSTPMVPLNRFRLPNDTRVGLNKPKVGNLGSLKRITTAPKSSCKCGG